MKVFYLIIMICFVLTDCSPSYATQLTSTVPPIKQGWIAFEGAGIRFIYPETWSKEELSNTGPFIILKSNSHEVNMNITRSQIGDFRDSKTIEDVDKAMWNFHRGLYKATGNIDRVKIESHETIKIGGQPATKGIYTAPAIQNPSQIIHKMLVLVVNGTDVYQIVVNASSASAMHIVEITEIIDSIQFLR